MKRTILLLICGLLSLGYAGTSLAQSGFMSSCSIKSVTSACQVYPCVRQNGSLVCGGTTYTFNAFSSPGAANGNCYYSPFYYCSHTFFCPMTIYNLPPNTSCSSSIGVCTGNIEIVGC